MALDGVFLRHLTEEIAQVALGARVEKVYQPGREEILLSLRSRAGVHKLLLCARANSARVHFTEHALENPKTPPMLCMLLRKKLCGAKITKVYQNALDRVLCISFSATDELGDPTQFTLVVEIMGKYSNIILLNAEKEIVDAVKRVDASVSSKRLILPGLKYQNPPAQDKVCLLDAAPNEIAAAISAAAKTKPLDKAILSCVQGLSPVVCRELAYQCEKDSTNFDIAQADMKEKLSTVITNFAALVKNTTGVPCLLIDDSGKPFDFSFMEIHQYRGLMKTKKCASFSALLDEFYYEKDKQERMRSRSHELSKLLSNLLDRLNRKIQLQAAELEACANRQQLKVFADLIHANIYKIQKGETFAMLENFYEPELPLVNVPLDPYLSATENAQKYYKEYRKEKTAELVLKEQIAKASQEKAYLETVSDALTRCFSEDELDEVRQELYEQRFLKRKSKKAKNKALEPLAFLSSDNFKILVGRNNHQNDLLTFKKAHREDLWFHVKDIPGCHTILRLDGNPPSKTAIKEAAAIAAFHSKAKDSSGVPVDYTKVRHVRKPNGARPGMVIYTNQKTIYVTPEAALVESLREGR